MTPTNTRGDYGPFGGHEATDDLPPTSPEEKRAAALVVAERAVAERWPLHDVALVLDALGLA